MRRPNLKPKKCLLLINVGSPQSPNSRDVKQFLRKFLNDKNVIDLPFISRKILVNCIIIPFHLRKSVALYKLLFRHFKSSPLIKYSKNLTEKLNKTLPSDTSAEFAMLYSSPYLKNIMKKLANSQVEEIIVFPLFPQYAKSTTGASLDRFQYYLKEFTIIPKISYIKCFFNHPLWIDSIIECSKKFILTDYDYFLFSYHSLPLKQVQNIHPDKKVKGCNCELIFDKKDKYCYKATCIQTTRLLVEKLGIQSMNYTTCFQSNFGKKWLEPFTLDVILELAKKGNKKLLIFSPSFAMDCLETYVEIGINYKKLFIKNGGEILDFVSCPNDTDFWVKSITQIIKNI